MQTFSGLNSLPDAWTFRPDAINAWHEYRETGLHATGNEVTAWLDTWGDENAQTAPICHK
jgi:predicted transcriptional regulator